MSEISTFIIDNNLRQIIIPDGMNILGVAGDIEVKCVSFEMPRYYNGIDMSEFDIFVDYENAKGYRNYYKVVDTKTHSSTTPQSSDNIVFTWTLESDVTAHHGTVTFAIRMVKRNGTKIVKQFDTDKATGIVRDGMNVFQRIPPSDQKDILGKIETDAVENIQEDLNNYTVEKKTELNVYTDDKKNVINEFTDSCKSAITDLTTTSKNEIDKTKTAALNDLSWKEPVNKNAAAIASLNEDLANIGKVITSESFSEQIASTSDFSARSTATLDINHYISTGLFGGIGGFKNGHHYKLVIITSETYYVTIKSLLYGSYEDVILDSMYMQSNTPYVIDIPITIDFSNANKYVVFQQGDNYVANANIYIYDVGTISEEILNNVDFSTHKNPIEYQSVNIPKKTFHNGNIQENIIYKEDASFLGDSLTAVGSGSQYIEFVSDGLGLSNTHNCGIYGTRVSGGESSSNSFWTNKRVNELSLNSGVLFIMGGTNDAAYITVQDSDFTIENHDTNNFIGAYNVLISKVLYKYLKLSSGYYSDIDYSEVTQATKVKPYFRIILITPPKRFDSVENLKKVEETANYVIKIGELWGLPVCDVNHLMSMNIINKDNYFTHQTEKDYVHFDVNGHRELANIVVGKVKSLN